MRHIEDHRLLDLLLAEGDTIRDAMIRIEGGAAEVALALDGTGRLRGVLTDGDVRRALLGGAVLDDQVEQHLTTSPVTVRAGTDRAAILDLMRARAISHIPEVDIDGRLTGLHLLSDVVGAVELPNVAVVMAGGRGSRLGGLTREVPKPMLEVAGRPILERIVLQLVGSGIRNVYLSVGYLAELVIKHFRDGSDFGCSIRYLHDDAEQPLGTGGPLRLLLDQELQPEHALFVMNGDLLTSFSLPSMLDAHITSGASLTMGCKEYVHDVPFGVVALNEHQMVTGLTEKPRSNWTVNAGTYIIEPNLLERIPADEQYPITDLVTDCLRRGERVLGWAIEGAWQDIGRPHELISARGQ